MKHAKTRLLLALLAALTLIALLAACSPKPLEEKDILSDLRRSGSFLPGRPKIAGHELISRDTDTKAGTDTVTLTVTVEDGVEAKLSYVLNYEADGKDWKLKSVERYEDGPWEIEGPSKRDLTGAAEKEDESLSSNIFDDLNVKTVSEAYGFDPEEGEYTKTLTLEITAIPLYVSNKSYTAAAEATFVLTKDGWELKRWKAKGSEFKPTDGPGDFIFTNAVYAYTHYSVAYDDIRIVDRGEDLEAGTAWAEVAAVRYNGYVTVIDNYRFTAVFTQGDGWMADSENAETFSPQAVWDESIFPISYTDSWGRTTGGLLLEGIDGMTVSAVANLFSVSDLSLGVRTTGATAALTTSPDYPVYYLFTLDDACGFFRLDPYDMSLYWHYLGFSRPQDYIHLSPTFNASSGPIGPGEDNLDYIRFSDGLDDNGYYTGVRALDYVTLPEFDELVIPDFDRIYDADRVIGDGDFVNIDFVGSMDGVEFEGGSTDGAGYDIVVGQTSFIDDFIEQLKGHAPGEEFDIEVTFPEEYGNDELNGKDAVFHITINYIWDITDENARAIGFDGRDDMGEYIAYYSYAVEDIVSDPGFSVFFTQAQCREVPNSVLETVTLHMRRMVELEAAQYAMYGFDTDAYVQYFYDASSLEEYLDWYAESDAEAYLIYQAVAERDGIAVTDADITEAGYDEYIDVYGRPYVAYVLLQNLVADHITENV